MNLNPGKTPMLTLFDWVSAFTSFTTIVNKD